MIAFNNTKDNERATVNKEDICNTVSIDNKLSSTTMTRILGNFMKQDRVGKRMRKLKTEDLVKKQFESAKAFTSSSLIAHYRINNLNNTRIVNHIKKNKATKEIALQRN